MTLNLSCFVCCSVTLSNPTLCDPMDYSPPGSSVPMDSPGKSTGMSCQFLLQGIFLTQGLNRYLISSALTGRFFTTSTTCEALLDWGPAFILT